jgi:hypothetical protein
MPEHDKAATPEATLAVESVLARLGFLLLMRGYVT